MVGLWFLLWSSVFAFGALLAAFALIDTGEWSVRRILHLVAGAIMVASSFLVDHNSVKDEQKQQITPQQTCQNTIKQ